MTEETQITERQSSQREFHLEPKLLRSCMHAMSKEKTRPYLMGVHVAEKGGSLVYEATDGHALVRITSELPQDNDLTGIDIIIPDFFVLELAKPSFLKGFGVVGIEFVPAVLHGKTVSVEMPNGLATQKLVEGDFPTTDAIFPKRREGTNALDSLGVNLSYVSAISKSAKAFSSYAVAIAVTAQDAPLYFRALGGPGKWEALLMPLRA